MKKTVVLQDEIRDENDNKVAEMITYLRGDGSTPVVQTMGGYSTGIIGYDNNGGPIFSNVTDENIKMAEEKMMAEAIKEQKKLCIANGVDPDLVNIINAEKKVNNE